MIPLSSGQQRLWFVHRSDPGTAYNVPLIVRLSGALDRAALRAAVADVVDRHEPLRTVFPDEAGTPVQRVLSPAEPHMRVVEVEREGLTAELATAAAHVFDLAAEPQLRATLFVVTPSEHVLLLLMHHIAVDGWSMVPMLRDLGAAYRARAGGRVPQWTPLPVQYTDYALWQRELLASGDDPTSLVSRQLGFWRSTLAGMPAELSLPTDRPRPAAPTWAGGVVPFELDAMAHRRLRALARDCGATLFTVVQAGLAALLTRLGAGEDIPIGTPVAGRTEEALTDLVGFFVNTMVLRADTSGNPSFAALVGRVRAAYLESLANQDVPFDQVVEAVNPVRSASRHPLFQVIVALDDRESSRDFGGLRVESTWDYLGNVTTAKFDLSFGLEERWVGDTPAGIGGKLEFAAELFDRETAQAIADRFVRLLTSVAAEPLAPVGQVDVLGPGELDLLLAWGTGPASPAAEDTLVGLFEAQVAQYPDAPALVSDDGALTYAELDVAANRLARRLLAAGVGRECPVVVLLERSAFVVVSMLAVLKAGGFFVPLPSGFPLARMAQVVASLRAPVLLTDRVFREHPLTACAGLEVVVVDDVVDGDWSVESPGVVVVPDQLMYVMFTSGSTGVPKGVAVSHRSVVAFVRDTQWRAADRKCVFTHSPHAFDPSIYELWAPLLSGGQLVVAPPGPFDGSVLERLVGAHEFSSAVFAAALFDSLSVEATEALCGIPLVWTGGDVVSPAAIERLRALNPDIRIGSGYGATEATVISTWYSVDPGRPTPGVLPIGRPMDNVRVYVLDVRLRPVPAGVSGELFIGGAGLARGYWGQPGLTAERFVADPFGAAGARMYRTGDVGRWNHEGCLEFVGRVDDQVKVRGHRVEPGEIEAVLHGLPQVRQAAVVLREDQPGDHRLVAYVAADGGDLDVTWLRKSVAAVLPDYMVPAGFVVLDALPVTVNGKLDRAALPAPDYVAGGYRPPRTPQEEVLCGIFADVLRVTRVGVDDSFFDLGGHSLLATRLIGRIRAVLGAELDLRTLFDTPTVAGLVDRLRPSDRPALTRAGRPTRAPLSFGQQRLWFLHRSEPGTAYNVPLVIRLTGALDRTALLAAVADVVDRHEPLRTVFPDDTESPYQHVLFGTEPWTRVVAVDEHELSAAMATAASHVFDLANETPLRATLFALSPTEHVLLLLFHHIAIDGWSTTPLLRDLAVAYAPRTRGETPGWTPLPVRYANYAMWQRELVAAADDPDSLVARQLTFWRSTLAGMPAELSLPTDRPRPAVPTWAGGWVPFELDAEVHAALVALARSAHATLFMVLQAGLATVLTRLGAGEDLPLGTAVAGRDDASNDLVGFFSNTLVLRTDTSGDPTFTALVGRVRDNHLAAQANQDVPFDQVVEAVNPARSAARHPLFQVIMALEDGEGPVELGDLRAEVSSDFLDGMTTAKFDLAFGLLQRQRGGDPAGIEGKLEFAAELFDRETAQAIADRFVRVLTAVVADPHVRIRDLDVLGVGERTRLLEWGRGSDAAAVDGSVIGLFEAQVARTPRAPAVTSSAVSFTYAELDVAANRLARRLLAAGVGRESPVVVLLERSAFVVVSMLAVLKAGGFFVPLPSGFPLARMERVVASLRAPVLLTDRVFREHPLTASAGVEVVVVDDVDGEGSAESPGVAVVPDQLMYVMFTSGSTGVPKGVAVSHRSVAAFVADSQWRDVDRARVFTHSPHAFDPSIYELWAPLLSGGELVVAPPGPFDAAMLRRLVHDHDFSSAVFAAALFDTLSVEATAPLSGVPFVWTGGDVVSSAAIERLRALNPDIRIGSGYGATEATVISTWYAVDPDRPMPRVLPIGRPMDNVRVHVLDARLRPVPAGVPGELYIGGPGLARGYWGQPGLTAERFVADPFGAAGARVYRTGDVGRWNHDGYLEFVGRVDDQVKVRGHRVEPGEIETVLHGLPQVRQAAVVLREDQPGDHRLVAYVVADGSDLDVTWLRKSVAAVLPDYMVPAGFVLLDALPVTGNGKLDRAALPAPDYVVDGYRAPGTPQEEVLCGLFADVLGVVRVGLDDSFFDLGGHSLLAARLIGRIRAVLGAELDLRTLFDTPTVAGLVDGLRPSDRPALTRAGRPTRVPLSSSQRGLWFLHRSDPGTAYNAPMVFRLTGSLDQAAFRAALRDVVDRHEPLRTVFPDEAGIPYQHVLPAAEPWTEVVAVGHEEARARLSSAAEHVFELATETPLRVSLFTLSPSEHVLLLLFHHIAVDGWSMAPLLRDVGAAYRARVSCEAPQWTRLPIDYADYALWQQGLLAASGDTESLVGRQLEFWRTALARLPQELNLPADRPRPAIAGYHSDAVTFGVDASTHTTLTALARSANATLFMVLQAGVAALLTRLGAGEDVPLSTTVAGRADVELDDLVGLFVNTLVLRTDTSGDPGFAALVDRVRENHLAAHSNQDVPFDRVVQAVNPRRSLAHIPLAQVSIIMPDTGEPDLDFGELEVESMPDAIDVVAPRNDLQFILTERRGDDALGGIDGRLAYRVDMFDRKTAQAIADRFVRLLTAVAADPERSIGGVDVLAADERDRLVRWGSGSDMPVAAETVVDLFEAQVARTPQAPALISAADTLTYAELNERANRLAWLLIRRGLGPEDVVGLALPHSADLVVAVLAVLKAGAAYLVVDTDHPAERIAFVLNDVAPSCLLATTSTTLPDSGAPVVSPDDPAQDDAPTTSPVDRDRRGPLRRSNAAYLLYTSGSNGRPKGVLVEHASVVDYLTWTSRAYPGACGTAVLHTSIGFDLTVTGLYTPLVNGGCVVLSSLKHDERPPTLPEGLPPFTFIKATPSHLPLLADAGWDFAQDVEILVGGEALTGEMLHDWHRTHPDSTVWNVYGPTEATVNCTEYRIPARRPIPAGRVPIGRPQGNARVHVLDAALRRAPVGVPGELFIAGGGLARGYRERPGLTAERFVADPFGPPGSRMYRTGDLVRWNHDGHLEFLGRADDQVKVRGHRVEPGEVEAVLRSLPAVRQAAVILREDQAGDHRLVAYVVPTDGGTPDTVALRRSTAARLPEHMVPAAFVVMDALPLTVNDKLDRAALPAPDYAVGGVYRAPRTPREEVLCGIFAEVLGMPRVGVDDDFFHLGGHSLLAARLIGRVREVLGEEIVMRTFFDTPTVAGLLDKERFVTQSRNVLLRLGSGGELPPLFCVHPALGMSWCYSGLVRHFAPERPVYGLQTSGLLGADRLRGSVEEMAEDYLAEMRSVQPHGPYHLLGWSFGGLVAHAIATRLRAEGEQVALLALMDSYPVAGLLPAGQVTWPEVLAVLLGRPPAGVLDDLGELPAAATPDEVAAIVRELNPVLASLTVTEITALTGAVANHLAITRRFVPAIFDGDVVFFRAVTDKPDGAPTVDLWRPHVAGRLVVHDIDCAHLEMTETVPLAEIGRTLVSVLDTQAAGVGTP